MASDITIAQLTVTPTVAGFVASVRWEAPNGQGCLVYMQPANFKFYHGTTNDFGAAVLSGESTIGLHNKGGLTKGQLYYVWARAVDADGNEGVLSTPATVTTLTTAPGPGSVGSGELQDNAVQTQHIANLAVTNGKILNLSADKLTAGTITALIEIIGPLIKTADSGTRLEISSSQNALLVYNGSTEVLRIRYQSGVIPLLNINSNFPIRAIANNTGAGCEYSNAGGGAGFTAWTTVAGANAHGLRGLAQFNGVGGSTPVGGFGLVGLSTAAGGFAFYTQKGGYGSFTGAHDGFILKAAEIEIGDIVCDVRTISRNGTDGTVTEVAQSSTVAQRTVIGILAARQPFDPASLMQALPNFDPETEPTWLRKHLATIYDRITINGVGEGQMNVCGMSGDIAAGDLIVTSNIPGKGQRQDDDLLRASTVAKARESVTFDYPEQVKRIACVYHCG
ncbi:MAG TPA: hypothetical protein VIL30_18055 [Ramlibacter sp.]|jgi:hypothetical protein